MKTDATTRAHVKTTSGSMMEPKYTKKTWTCETNMHVLSDRDLQLQLACENEAFTLEGKNMHLCTSKYASVQYENADFAALQLHLCLNE